MPTAPAQAKPTNGEAKAAKAESSGAARAAYADELIDTAYSIRESYSKLLKARTANREALRQMQAQDHLDAEQAKEVEELYPQRKQVTQEAEESDATKAPEKAPEKVAA